MDEFSQQGFFSEGAREFRGRILAVYPELWNEALRLNAACQNLQYELEIHENSQHEMISAVLYARSLSTFQGYLAVAERGMVHQTKMLIRCILETVFPLVAVSQDFRFSERIIQSEEVERLKGINKLIRYLERTGDREDELNDARVLAAQVKEEVHKAGARKLTLVESAEKAGLVDWYDTAYSLLSNTVHSSLRSLEEHVDVNDQGNVEGLTNEPSMADFDKLCVTSMEAMLHAVRAVGTIFGQDVEQLVEDTAGRIRNAYAESVD